MPHSHIRLTKFAHISKLDKCQTEVIYTPVTIQLAEAGRCQKSTECDRQENNPGGRDIKNHCACVSSPDGFQSSVSLPFVVSMLTVSC